jgi:hypothetical protein
MLYTSIALKNQLFSSELKLKTIYSDIRAALANRHAQSRCHTEPAWQME